MRILPAIFLALLIITACQPIPEANPAERTAEEIPETTNEETEIEEREDLPQPVIIDEPKKEQQTLSANDDGYAEWKNARGGASLLVSDGRQAARLFVRPGQTVPLATQPPVNVTVARIGTDGQVEISVNGMRDVLREGENELFLHGRITVHVSEVIIP